MVKLLGSRQVEVEDAETRVQEMIRVFLVDTGMVVVVSTTGIAECKVEFVERLPFQAIRWQRWGLFTRSGPVGKGTMWRLTRPWLLTVLQWRSWKISTSSKEGCCC